MKNLFQIGDTVYHKTKQKYGVVKDVFQSGDSYRYYVQHSGWTWSVPQECLNKKTPHKTSIKSDTENDDLPYNEPEGPKAA